MSRAVPKLAFWQAPVSLAGVKLPQAVLDALERSEQAAVGHDDILPLVTVDGTVIVDVGTWEEWFGPVESDLTSRKMARLLIERLEEMQKKEG